MFVRLGIRRWWQRFTSSMEFWGASSFRPQPVRRGPAEDPVHAKGGAARFAVLWFAVPAVALILMAYLQHRS